MVNMKYCKVEIHELSWFNHWFIILYFFLTVPKEAKIISINANKAKSKSMNIENKRKQWYIKTDSNLLIFWL